MAETRKPDSVLWIRSTQTSGQTHGPEQVAHPLKIEFFAAAKFERIHNFTDRHGFPIALNNLEHYFRMRVNGGWFPKGRKILYTKNQCVTLLKKELFKP